MPSVAADYYDGRSAERRDVVISLDEDRIHVSGEGIERSLPAAQLRVSRRRRGAPRVLAFEDGAFCEVRDHVALKRLLGKAGSHASRATQMRSRVRRTGLVLIASVLLGVLVDQYGIPALAQRVAHEVPPAAIAALSEDMLTVLDQQLATPSRLPPARQRAIAERFDALRTPDGVPVSHRVVFRDSRFLGPNALALPDGTLVLFDDLVALAHDDDELMGVLAHEQGHVRARHSLRHTLEDAPLDLLRAWITGDATHALSAAAMTAEPQHYPREVESAADHYAAQLLAANGVSPARLADLLERIEERGRAQASPRDYVSTHPPTGERLQALRGTMPAPSRP